MIEQVIVARGVYSFPEEIHILHKIESDGVIIIQERFVLQPSPLLINQPIYDGMKRFYRWIEDNGFSNGQRINDCWIYEREVEGLRQSFALSEVVNATS